MTSEPGGTSTTNAGLLGIDRTFTPPTMPVFDNWGDASVWWRFTPLEDAYIEISAKDITDGPLANGENPNVTMTLYVMDDAGNLTQVAFGADAEDYYGPLPSWQQYLPVIRVSVTAGVHYYLEVGTYQGESPDAIKVKACGFDQTAAWNPQEPLTGTFEFDRTDPMLQATYRRNNQINTAERIDQGDATVYLYADATNWRLDPYNTSPLDLGPSWHSVLTGGAHGFNGGNGLDDNGGSTPGFGAWSQFYTFAERIEYAVGYNSVYYALGLAFDNVDPGDPPGDAILVYDQPGFPLTGTGDVAISGAVTYQNGPDPEIAPAYAAAFPVRSDGTDAAVRLVGYHGDFQATNPQALWNAGSATHPLTVADSWTMGPRQEGDAWFSHGIDFMPILGQAADGSDPFSGTYPTDGTHWYRGIWDIGVHGTYTIQRHRYAWWPRRDVMTLGSPSLGLDAQRTRFYGRRRRAD